MNCVLHWMRRFGATLAGGRLFARAMAAWLASVTLILLWRNDSFTELSYAQEGSIGALLVIALLFFALLSVLAMLLPRVHTDSWGLLLFATVCVGYWSVGFATQSNKFFIALALAAAYALVLVYFWQTNRAFLTRVEIGLRTVWGVAAVAGVISCVMIAALGCLRYRTFSAPNFDFGIFCNAFYNMTESGLPMTCCERNTWLSHFAVHVSPVFYLLLPFYWLFPSPMTLQIAQAIVLTAGVIPVVLLARHYRLSGKVTALLAILYSFYPALSTGCFYDFHENCFLPLLLLLTFLFYEKKKYIPMYVSACLVLTVKEDAAIYLLLFAVYILLAEREYLHGAVLSAIAVGYFLLCTYLLKRYGLGVMSNRFDNLIYQPEDGLMGAIKTALLNPGYVFGQLLTVEDGKGFEKVMYAIQMLLPLGFLPFCTKKPSRWLLLAPMLINLLTQYVYQYDIGFQYHFGITAFLFYAMIKNLPELKGDAKHSLLGIAAAACLCFYLTTMLPYCTRYIALWQDNRENYREIEAVLDTSPEEASVSCSTFFLPHLANREVVYETYYHKNIPDIDFVVLDLRSSDSNAVRREYLRQGYEVVTEREGLVAVLKAGQ